MGDFPYKDPSAARYDGSTLVVRGSKSQYVADDVLPVIGQFFPRFILKDIDSGHWVISEQPEAFRQGEVPLPVFTMGPLLTTRSCCRIHAACRLTGHLSLKNEGKVEGMHRMYGDQVRVVAMMMNSPLPMGLRRAIS